MALSQPTFGVCVAGCPVTVTPSSIPAPNSLTFNLPDRNFNHIVVFLLPGITLPPDTAAAVYLGTASQNAVPSFKFIGGVGNGRESAIFKVRDMGSPNASAAGVEVDMDTPQSVAEATQSHDAILGISIEPAASVEAQMAALTSTQEHSRQPSSVASEATTSLVRRNQQRPDTLVLAQRIIKNAFNFLASFSGNVNGGVEVVPLKAFEDWWKKFEGRVRSDPGFLEKDAD